ncbi:MAG: flagellar hook-length control protein FliK [Pseudomonas sp.]|nr:flagellar hook-length control protein FliK [Pseudomonas sp.]
MQLISGSTTAAGAADAVMQPVRPVSLSGHAAARADGNPVVGRTDFRARLLSAAVELELTAQPQAPAAELPVSAQPHTAENVSEAAGEEAAEQGTAEQWLLGMLDQQQVQVQARDSFEVALQAGWPLAAAQADGVQDGLADKVVEAQLLGRVAPPPAQGQPERLLANAAWVRPVVETGAALSLLAPAVGATELVAELPVEALKSPGVAEEVREASPLLGERPASSVAPGAERLLKLQAPEAKWGEQMLHALREHVEVQLQQRQQSASIRLDPPELGSLEIHLSHESGRLTVQLSAANADVARLLQQTSDRLRQELVAQQFVQVNVQVGADGRSGRQGQSQQGHDDEAVLAAAAPTSAATVGSGAGRSSDRGKDVLVTV